MSSLRPSAIIVPHDGDGGCTPAPRNDSAASSRIALATMSGKNTSSVDARFGSSSLNMIRRLPEPWARAASTNSFSRSDEDLAADRPREVDDVDDADDERRDPQRAGRWSSMRPDVEAAERERDAERDAEQQHGERPHDVEAAGDDRVDPAAEVAGEQAEDHREQRS